MHMTGQEEFFGHRQNKKIAQNKKKSQKSLDESELVM
jgi:hypothetical protein